MLTFNYCWYMWIYLNNINHALKNSCQWSARPSMTFQVGWGDAEPMSCDGCGACELGGWEKLRIRQNSASLGWKLAELGKNDDNLKMMPTSKRKTTVGLFFFIMHSSFFGLFFFWPEGGFINFEMWIWTHSSRIYGGFQFLPSIILV